MRQYKLTPAQLFVCIIIAILIAEFGIMMFLHHIIKSISPVAEALIDSLLLILLLFPILYIFAFRPIIFRIRGHEMAERALKESGEQYGSVVETVSDAVVMINEESTILFANHALEDIFGYTQTEIIGQKITILMPEHLRTPHIDALKSYIATGVKKYSWKGIGFPGLHKSGKEIPLEISFGEFLKEGRHIFTGIVRDVTERKQSEEKLQRYTEELERSNRELQDFAYISSHDLQEPLRKVIAFGDRLKMKYSETLGEDGLDYLERMNNATGRMQTLINDLLTYSRVTTKAKPFNPVNLKDVISQIVVDLENRITQTGGRVDIGDLPVIDADKTQMFQLFQNLISNALKFHKTGEAPVVTVKSRLIPSPQPSPQRGEGEGKGRFYEITVEDNGIGFDEKHLERIFKPFERLHGRKEYEGTGMGLPICRKIVSRHGGRITAKSSPDKGSAFIVTLPERQKELRVKNEE